MAKQIAPQFVFGAKNVKNFADEKRIMTCRRLPKHSNYYSYAYFVSVDYIQRRFGINF